MEFLLIVILFVGVASLLVVNAFFGQVTTRVPARVRTRRQSER